MAKPSRMSKASDINVRVGADIRQFSSAMQNIDRGTKRAGKSLGSFGAAAKFGLAGVGVALVGVAASSVRLQADFEASMSKVKALTGETGAAFTAMQEKAKELGRTTPHSAKAAAEGMQSLAMAGYDANQIMRSIGGTLKLASIAGIELGRSADIATNILSQFGKSASDTDAVVDQLAQTVTSHNTDMEQMSEAMKFLGPTAKALKIPMSEAGAVIGVLGDNGLQGSVATRALGTSLVSLAKPTKAMQSEMDKLGVEFFNAKGEFIGINGVVEQLEGAFVGMSDKQKQAALTTIFGKESIQEFNILLSAGSDKLKDYTKEIKNSDGAATRMANTMEDNLAGDFKKLTSALDGLLLGTGAISKGLRGIVQAGTALIGGLAELTSGSKSATSQFHEQSRELANNELAAKPLIKRYDELAKKEKLTKDETEELKTVTQQLAKIYPLAITQVNEYGHALGINTDKIGDLNDKQREHIKLLNKEAVEEKKLAIARLKTLNANKQEDINRGYTVKTTTGGGGGGFGGSTQTTRIQNTTEKVIELRSEMSKLQESMAESYIELEKLGETLTDEQKEIFKVTVAGHDRVKKSTQKLIKVKGALSAAAKLGQVQQRAENVEIQKTTGLIPKLEAEIKAAELAKRALFDDAEIKNAQIEIEKLEDQLKSLTDTSKGSGPFSNMATFGGSGFVPQESTTVSTGGGMSVPEVGKITQLQSEMDALIQTQAELSQNGDDWKFYQDQIEETRRKMAELKNETADVSSTQAWAAANVEKVNEVAAVTNAATQAVNAVSQASHDIKMGRINAEYQAEKARIMGSTMSEEDRAARMNALDKKMLKKKQEIALKRAKIEKGVALVSAIVNGAAAVVKALNNPYPLNLVFAASTAVAAGAQVASIASQPLPQLADGGIAYGRTAVEVGEYSGASVNPEVIAPLNKLRDIIGGSGGGALPPVIQLSASGRDLFAVLKLESDGRYRQS